jgi:hypothetical protein
LAVWAGLVAVALATMRCEEIARAALTTGAAIATIASAVGNSNLVEICMLTHTSASRNRAWFLVAKRSADAWQRQAKISGSVAICEWIS